jgi:hypothetical protein
MKSSNDYKKKCWVCRVIQTPVNPMHIRFYNSDRSIFQKAVKRGLDVREKLYGDMFIIQLLIKQNEVLPLSTPIKCIPFKEALRISKLNQL